MAYTLLDIANSALVKIGAKPVQSLVDDTPSGRLVALRLRPVMDTVLSMHPFSCAMKRAIIPPNAEKNTVVFAYTYSVPTDLLRMIRLEDSEGVIIYDYELIGQEISCDSDPLVITYIRSLYADGKIDYDVAEAMALYLAYDICERIDENSNKRQQLYSEFQQFYSQIKTTDSRKMGPKSYGPINVYGPIIDQDRPREIIDYRL